MGLYTLSLDNMTRYILILFFLPFLIFNLNLNLTVSGDATPARLLPFNLFSGRGFYFDDYLTLLPKDPYFFQKFKDHAISSYPITAGLISIPFYLPFFAYLKINHLTSIEDYYSYSFVAEKFSASLLASLSVVAIFFFLKIIFKNTKKSFIFALIFAFATQTFSISSQHLWQHTVANLFLILSQILFIKALNNNIKKRTYFILSLVFGLFCLFSRYIFLIYLLILLSFIFLMDKRHGKSYIAIALIGIVVFLSLVGFLYGFLVGPSVESVSYLSLSNILPNLAILLFSPAQGVVFYTPFFIFSFASIFLWKNILKENLAYKMILIQNLIFLFAVLILDSSFRLPSGWSWGDRYLSDGAVSAVILSYYFLSQHKNRLLKALFFITIFISVLAQAIGVFYHPRGHWNDYPKAIEDDSTERLWDFKDNPLIRNLSVGPELNGIYGLYYTIVGLNPNSKIYSENDKRCSIEKIGEDDSFGFKKVRVKFHNNSDVDWLSGGDYPLTLRQIFIQQRRAVIDSPIPSTPLPPVIQAKSAVTVAVRIIPPGAGFYQVVIAPVREGDSWWDKYCKLIVSSK